MERLRHSWALQATLGSACATRPWRDCATRFKFFKGGRLLHTECAYCGQVDSYEHLVSCVNIGPPPGEPEELVEYLVELTDRAYNVNPGYPRQLAEGGGAELELIPSEEGDGSDSGQIHREVEDDTLQPFDVEAFLSGLPEEPLDCAEVIEI